MSTLNSKKLSAGPKSLLAVVVLGCVIGYLGGSALVLFPWALLGLAIGVLSISRKVALTDGGVFGFALAYVFMIAGYNGADPISTKVLPFLIFGLVGAFCGAILALIGYSAIKLLNKK